MKQQILMSGVGGQGILFVTRLIAEAALQKGIPVLTSETHGMAQRGGTVLSHLKVGGFSSPLIRPAQADGLVLLKEENLAHHRCYCKPGGWVVVNSPSRPESTDTLDLHWIDAEGLAEQIGNQQAVNLIVLGFAASRIAGRPQAERNLFCSAEDIAAALHRRLGKRENLLAAALKAFERGVKFGKK